MFRYTFKCYSKATSLNDLDTLSQRLSSWTASANRRRYVHRWRKLFEQGDRLTLETFSRVAFTIHAAGRRLRVWCCWRRSPPLERILAVTPCEKRRDRRLRAKSELNATLPQQRSTFPGMSSGGSLS